MSWRNLEMWDPVEDSDSLYFEAQSLVNDKNFILSSEVNKDPEFLSHFAEILREFWIIRYQNDGVPLPDPELEKQLIELIPTDIFYKTSVPVCWFVFYIHKFSSIDNFLHKILTNHTIPLISEHLEELLDILVIRDDDMMFKLWFFGETDRYTDEVPTDSIYDVPWIEWGDEYPAILKESKSFFWKLFDKLTLKTIAEKIPVSFLVEISDDSSFVTKILKRMINEQVDVDSKKILLDMISKLIMVTIDDFRDVESNYHVVDEFFTFIPFIESYHHPMYDGWFLITDYREILPLLSKNSIPNSLKETLKQLRYTNLIDDYICFYPFLLQMIFQLPESEIKNLVKLSKLLETTVFPATKDEISTDTVPYLPQYSRVCAVIEDTHVCGLYINSTKLRNVPECVTGFSQLKTLDLSYDSVKIPEYISKFNRNTTERRIPHKIELKFECRKIFGLTQLEELNLSGIKINSSELEKVTRIEELRCLHLSNCSLERIPDSIGDLQNLKYLILSKNHLKSLSTSLTNIKLKYIDIEDNHFDYSSQETYKLLRVLAQNGCQVVPKHLINPHMTTIIQCEACEKYFTYRDYQLHLHSPTSTLRCRKPSK